MEEEICSIGWEIGECRALEAPSIPGVQNGFFGWQYFKRADSDLTVSLRRATGIGSELVFVQH